MGLVKGFLKKTGAYKYIKNLHNEQAASQWTQRDQEMLNFYSQFASAGDLVFDVGANIGNRTKIFLKMGTEVVAIEPQDDCVRFLHKSYGASEHLVILQSVLGPSVGEAELLISSANTLSTVSKDWVDSVKSSGRFSTFSWTDKKLVPMTTLDQLIESHGKPAFIKVDVEGFEHEVISGLSQPVNHISLEFTPECIDSTFKCIGHLESLGNMVFNYSLGESMELALEKYVSSGEIKNILHGYENDISVFGDVYCQHLMR